MAAIKYIKRTVALDGNSIADTLPESLFDGEQTAHMFIIAAMRDGEPLTLSGLVSGIFLNANDESVPLTGTIVNGAATITLSNACYHVNGRFTLTISVSGAVVYKATGRISRRMSNTAYDPTGVIPNLDEIQAEVASMRAATTAANQAASAAANVANTVNIDLAAGTDKATITITRPDGTEKSQTIRAVVGGDYNSLTSALDIVDGVTIAQWMPGARRCNTIGSVIGEPESTDGDYVHAIMACTTDNKVTASVYGARTACAWAYLDADKIVLACSEEHARIVDTILPTPPENTAYVLLNNRTGTTYMPYGYYGFIGDAVNERLDALEESDDKTKNAVYVAPFDAEIDNEKWQMKLGGITFTTGVFATASNRLVSINILPESIRRIVANDGYSFAVLAYNGASYVGCYDGKNGYGTSGVWMSTVDIPINNYVYRLVVRRTDNADIALAEISNIKCYGRMEIENEAEVIENLTDLYNGNSYIALNNATLGTTMSLTPTSQAGWKCAVFPCKKMEKFSIVGRAASAAPLWGFVDKDFKLINCENGTITRTDPLILYAPSDGYIFSNLNVSTHRHTLLRYNTTAVRDSRAVYHTNWMNKLAVAISGFSVGDTVPFALNKQNAEARYQIITCYRGQVFRLNGITEYALLDHRNVLKEYGTSDGLVIVSEPGILVVNGNIYKDANVVCYSFDESEEPLFKIPDNADLVVRSVSHDITTWPRFDTLIGYYDALVTNHPDLVTKTSIGKDANGEWDMYRYDITPQIPEQQSLVATYELNDVVALDRYPTIMLDACIHGSERPCALALCNFATAVCESNEPIFQWLRTHIHFIIVPLGNPWGYVNYSRVNSNGVDLNRNSYVYWAEGGASGSSHYKGASPASEAETQHLIDILLTLQPKKTAYFSFHTHGNWNSYKEMTVYDFPPKSQYKETHAVIGTELNIDIMQSGHDNHNLPTDSGYIGETEIGYTQGVIEAYGDSLGIFSCSPELMYKYYTPDGSGQTVWSTDTNTMNCEYILRCVYLVCKYHLCKQ